MNTKNQNYNPTDDAASADDRLPEKSAPDVSGPPSGDGDQGQTQEPSWEHANANLEGQTQEPLKKETSTEDSDLAKLKVQLEEERKLRETAEKRMSDTHREFKSQREELKELRERLDDANKRDEGTEKLKDDQASGKLAAPDVEEEDIDVLSEEYGLSEDERELLELNPEMGTALMKILDKRLASGLSEREKENQRIETELRRDELEKQAKEDMEKQWLTGLKNIKPDAEELLRDDRFNVWLDANEPLRRILAHGKDPSDPSIAAEMMDRYEAEISKHEAFLQNRSQGRQALVSHQTTSGTSANGVGDKSWGEINAELERSNR